MNPVPTSLMAAIALSAATGKNPWLPFGVLFLVAAPESVPDFVLDPALHAALHALASPATFYVLAVVFLGVATLESLADKLPLVERWLVPVSTMWRPFAGVALSSLIAFAVAGGPAEVPIARLVTAEAAGGDVSLSVVIVVLGSTFGAIAAVSKTGIRLLLSHVPVPGLRLAHSFIDDFFALGATGLGLVMSDHVVTILIAGIYLGFGLMVAPLLSRLAWIHLRIGLGILRKARRHTAGPPPAWLERRLKENGFNPATTAALGAYVYRAEGIGRCRSGYVVVGEAGAAFVVSGLIRTRWCRLAEASTLERLGLAETLTGRALVCTIGGEGTARREVSFYLFPAEPEEVHGPLEAGTAAAGLAAVGARTESARRCLVGYAERSGDGRYREAGAVGDLRVQALTTLIFAAAVGFLTGGVFVPIGTGYLLSPWKHRFWIGMATSAYLAFCVLASAFFGWPAAVVYAVVLNTLALRDLARGALKARVDGFVDRDEFLPTVCNRVWVPEDRVSSPADRFRPEDPAVMIDGSWRQVFASTD